MHHRKHYCNILGLSENASLEEIKKAYFHLSNLYHPDKNSDPSATKKFEEINDAYNALKNNKFLTNNYYADTSRNDYNDFDDLEKRDNEEKDEEEYGDDLFSAFVKMMFRKRTQKTTKYNKNKKPWRNPYSYIYIFLSLVSLSVVIGIII